MKKSKIITKIMLALVMVALVFALVACGESGGSSSGKSGGKDKNKDKGTTKVEKSVGEYLGEIIGTADGLLKEAQKIPTAKAAYLSLALGVDYKTMDAEDASKVASEGKYDLSIKGNVKESNPSLDIQFKAPKSNKDNQGKVTSVDKGFEWFRLGYKDNTLYIKQPVTAVNTTSAVNATAVNVAALSDAVDDLMYIAVDALAGGITSANLGSIDLAALPNDPKIKGVLDMVEGVLTVKQEGSNYVITGKPSLWGMISNFTTSVPVVGPFLPGIINGILGGEDESTWPSLKIIVTTTGGVLSNLEIGFENNNGSYGLITLAVSLSTSSTVTIDAPSYATDALQAQVKVTADQKKLAAELTAKLSANMRQATENYFGYATFKVNDKVSEGYVKDGSAYFDLAQAFEALGKEYADTYYTANIQDNTIETTDEDGVKKVKITEKDVTLVEFLKNAAKQAKDNYIADKAIERIEPTEGEEEATAPSMGMIVSIYEWLLKQDSNKTEAQVQQMIDNLLSSDGSSYEDPAEKDVMVALNNLIKDYINFTIDVTSDSNNYAKTVVNILKVLGDNDKWLIGFDLIDSNKLTSNVTSFDTLFVFSNWLYGYDDNVDSFDAWSANLKSQTGFPQKGADGDTKFGIFDWNTETYSGGVVVYAEGDNNDLLDAVNAFAKWGTKGAFTSANLSEFFNFYIAKAGYYLADDVVFSASQKAAIDTMKADYTAADKTYKEKKDAYNGAKAVYSEAVSLYEKQATADNKTARDAAKTAFEAAENALEAAKKARDEQGKAYDDALKAWMGDSVTGYADIVINKLVGYAAPTANYLKSWIDNGLYLELGSAKNAGIYGFIAAHDSKVVEGVAKKGDNEYAKVEASIGIVSNDVEAKAKAFATAEGDKVAKKLNDFLADDDGFCLLDNDGEVQYPNASDCIDMFLALWDAYVAYVPAQE